MIFRSILCFVVFIINKELETNHMLSHSIFSKTDESIIDFNHKFKENSEGIHTFIYYLGNR